MNKVLLKLRERAKERRRGSGKTEKGERRGDN